MSNKELELVKNYIPEIPGVWIPQICDEPPYFYYVSGDRLCMVTGGDGSTNRDGYNFVRTTKREDGFYDHLYKIKSGK